MTQPICIGCNGTGIHKETGKVCHECMTPKGERYTPEHVVPLFAIPTISPVLPLAEALHYIDPDCDKAVYEALRIINGS